jgi:hypothetical protein
VVDLLVARPQKGGNYFAYGVVRIGGIGDRKKAYVEFVVTTTGRLLRTHGQGRLLKYFFFVE